MLAALDSADAMVSIEGENMRGVTRVVIEKRSTAATGASVPGVKPNLQLIHPT